MRMYDICYGFLNKMDEGDTSMWMYEEAENMADMIRKLVGKWTANDLNFRILDMSERKTTIYIPAADANDDGEFRRIYLYRG